MANPRPAEPPQTRAPAAAWRAHLRVLALAQCASHTRSVPYHLALLLAHLAGLLLVARLAHWPLWSAPALWLAFALPPLFRRALFAEALAPLGLLYALALVRLALVRGLGVAVPLPLDYGWALSLAAAWAALIALRCAGRLWLAWVLAALFGAGLYAWQLWRLAPAGVTGADPFAYVQMALDLAAHGSPRHLFPLAPLAARLGLSPLPVTHVGYVLPDSAGWAPTVWPPGFSVLLAAAYRLGGERLLLGANAWVGLASLGAAAALAVRLAPPGSRSRALAVGAAAVLLLATSPEQWVRLAVPLADGFAQLTTTLAVLPALAALSAARASASGPAPAPASVASPPRSDAMPAWPVFAGLGVLCGLALGAAFSVRYTQALLAPGLLAVAWWALPPGRRRWAFGLSLALAAFLAAAPDLVYRARLYGAPWRFGTGELALFSLTALPGALRQVAVELLRPEEFGLLIILGLLGIVSAWRRRRLPLLLVAAAYGPVVMFHLWYPFLRARDLLFVLVPLVALIALGGAAASAWLWRRGTAPRLALVAAVLLLAAVRLAPLLGRAPGFYTFGALLPEQRAAVASLAALTEPGAVIACSLNSGAVELYAGRLTVRPGRVLQPGAAWSAEQWLAFADALRAEGRPLYVLADSPELDAPLAELRARYRLTPVAGLYLPAYAHAGGSRNQLVPLWRVEVAALP